jgi:putative transposase
LEGLQLPPWCPKGTRPIVPCHHIREYRYAHGAVEPKSGSSFFLVLPRCDTDCMNVFLRELSKKYKSDYVLLVTDNARRHKSKRLVIPDNIKILFIPPRTHEMNPIEQIWKEIRKRGFKNKLFRTLTQVVDHLCDTINFLSADTIKSIAGRDWILSMCYL